MCVVCVVLRVFCVPRSLCLWHPSSSITIHCVSPLASPVFFCPFYQWGFVGAEVSCVYYDHLHVCSFLCRCFPACLFVFVCECDVYLKHASSILFYISHFVRQIASIWGGERKCIFFVFFYVVFDFGQICVIPLSPPCFRPDSPRNLKLCNVLGFLRFFFGNKMLFLMQKWKISQGS